MVEGSVSKNPFLRPGYGQKPQPNPVQNNFKPKSIPQKDMSKEIEFRGYFVLNSKPYFCLLNKKSNHAEWLSISEVSYEEFKVHGCGPIYLDESHASIDLPIWGEQVEARCAVAAGSRERGFS